LGPLAALDSLAQWQTLPPLLWEPLHPQEPPWEHLRQWLAQDQV
jgi:hypothetical protein